jgi:hypothetical protein
MHGSAILPSMARVSHTRTILSIFIPIATVIPTYAFHNVINSTVHIYIIIIIA